MPHAHTPQTNSTPTPFFQSQTESQDWSAKLRPRGQAVAVGSIGPPGRRNRRRASAKSTGPPSPLKFIMPRWHCAAESPCSAESRTSRRASTIHVHSATLAFQVPDAEQTTSLVQIRWVTLAFQIQYAEVALCSRVSLFHRHTSTRKKRVLSQSQTHPNPSPKPNVKYVRASVSQ